MVKFEYYQAQNVGTTQFNDVENFQLFMLDGTYGKN